MEFGTVRFNEMQRYIGTVTFKTLSSTLKQLEADGLVNRKEYPQIPPKVEYSLTKKGESLMPIIHEMCEWGRIQKAKFVQAPGRFFFSIPSFFIIRYATSGIAMSTIMLSTYRKYCFPPPAHLMAVMTIARILQVAHVQ